MMTPTLWIQRGITKVFFSGIPDPRIQELIRDYADEWEWSEDSNFTFDMLLEWLIETKRWVDENHVNAFLFDNKLDIHTVIDYSW